MQISPDERPERSASTSASGKWIILAIGLCILAGLVYFVLMPDTLQKPVEIQPEILAIEEPKLITHPASAPVEDIPQQPEPIEQPLILPTLDDSDIEARLRLNSLTPAGRLEKWFHTDHLIRRSITLIDGLSRGVLLQKMINAPSPKGKFIATKKEGKLWVDPVNYQRYNYLTDTLNAIDSNKLVELFHQFRPLLEQAYGELGYPPEDLDNAIIAALDQILSTPIPVTPVALTQESVHYQYADSRLEALPPIQKQLLRMGPEHTQKIQKKASELRASLLNRKRG
tara:strand:+ start:6960 stop:7811 length:852 start_codon:yes stop_codon:yes gene_type:complete